MKILVIGSGGREHALCLKFSQSPKVKKVYCVCANAGISEIAENVDIDMDDFEKMADFAAKNSIDFTFVGPEIPLSAGIVDFFKERGLKIIGPAKKAARLESSKIYAKEFMEKNDIPTAKYRAFSDKQKALEYLSNIPENKKIVVKADGLAAGKGVYVCDDKEKASLAVKALMKDKVLGAAGDEIIIEEFIDGQELSYLVFTDGRHYQMMPASQDHKRINDNDEGPNTGGMGAYCPAPLADETLNKEVEERVIKKTIEGIVAERLDYTGILYAGIIVKEGKISVLEFNCRFGDPETQSVLPLLDTDLADICLAILSGRLNEIEIAWKKESAVCIVLASGGYPAKYKTGFEIKGLDLVKDAFVFHAGTKKENGKVLTSGGRVLNVVSKSKTIKEAIDKAYKNAALISFEGAHYRKDIAQRALKFESEKINVAIIAGSDSDLEIIRETTKTLDEFGLKYCINIASAHRTPQYLKERMEEAIRRGAKVFIAGAGMAAALPGAVAAETTLPVIGIPISGKALSSFDSLFSIVQMPRGVPVAAVAIGKSGAVNAAVLAAQIIAISDKELSEKLCEYKKKMAEIVISKDLKLQKDGIDGYLGKPSDKERS